MAHQASGWLPAAAPGGLASACPHRETGSVSSWGSLSFGSGPILAFLVVGVLILLLRWAFSTGHSLVERRPQQGRADEYGALVPVAEPATFVEAELILRRLQDSNIRATLAPTTEGPRVMVFGEDEKAARAILAGPPGPPGSRGPTGPTGQR